LQASCGTPFSNRLEQRGEPCCIQLADYFFDAGSCQHYIADKTFTKVSQLPCIMRLKPDALFQPFNQRFCGYGEIFKSTPQHEKAAVDSGRVP